MTLSHVEVGAEPTGAHLAGSLRRLVPQARVGSPHAVSRRLTTTMVIGIALSIAAAALLGLVLDVTAVGGLRHDHAQATAYAKLRSQLANAVAPTGALTADGQPLAVGAPIALLRIPAAGVEETVLQGTSAGVLMDGPGHLRPSAFPGQPGTSVIYGRRFGFGGPFGRVTGLTPGSLVRIVTGQGTATYRVRGIRRAGDPAPAPPASGAGRLVLVTSAGQLLAPTGVVRVDADLVSAPFPAMASTAPTMAASERPLAGDSDAWVGLVLWGEALILAAIAFVWARARWGRWQAWLAGLPALAALGVAVADQGAQLLPNLL